MTPYGKIFKILFRKFSLRHRSTLLCSNFVKCCRRKIGEIVRYLPDQKNFGCLSNCSYCADRAQNLLRPAATMYSMLFECARFHPNQFTFGRVIAERVNTVVLPLRVFPL